MHKLMISKISTDNGEVTFFPPFVYHKMSKSYYSPILNDVTVAADKSTALVEISKTLSFMISEFAKESDANLTSDAIKLKRLLNSRIR
jgi:hypothetical protein